MENTQFRSPEPIFRPRSVAIVGASETGGAGWPARVHENLAFAGFPTEVFLINPRREELWGKRCYPDFASLPRPADLAVTIIPADAIPDVLAEGLAAGLKGALVFAAQFGEGGDEAGRERGRRLKELSDAGLRICGPNCMGALALGERNLFYPSPRVRGLPAGHVGVVFQSGGTFQYWLQQGAVRGLGFSYAVSSGNEIDVDLADYVNFLVQDPSTRVIACMVEGIRRPAAFMRAAALALEAGKPILMVKIGRSERGAAQTESHTGALAGDDKVVDAVCRKYGVLRCHSLDDMIEHALVFQAGRVPAGSRVAMACYSGGAKGLFLDYADEVGLELATFGSETAQALLPQIDPGLKPENPLDAGATPAVLQDRFSRICRTIAADPGTDIVALQGQLPMTADEKLDPGVFRAIADATGKPVVAVSRLAQNVTEFGRDFQAEAGIPFLQGLPQAARALAGLAAYAEARRVGRRPLPPAAKDATLAAPLEDEVARYGVRVPASRLTRSIEEAAEAASAIGFPAVLKIVSAQASHKTEVGGVAVGLGSADAVREAGAAMTARLHRAVPDAEISGFLVQEMLKGLEVIVGFRDDPDYGPLLVLGLGGILVEAIRDVSFRLLPVDERDVAAMIAELRGRKLFGAFRGMPARDVAALSEAVAALSRFFLDHRASLSDLEINPLIVLGEGEGVRAVDIRGVRRPANAEGL